MARACLGTSRPKPACKGWGAKPRAPSEARLPRFRRGAQRVEDQRHAQACICPRESGVAALARAPPSERSSRWSVAEGTAGLCIPGVQPGKEGESALADWALAQPFRCTALPAGNAQRCRSKRLKAAGSFGASVSNALSLYGLVYLHIQTRMSKKNDTCTKRVLSESHRQALEAGRQEALSRGFTSQQIGEQKAQEALLWVYRWGWSSAAVLDEVVNTARGSIASRLERRGLLKRARTPSGGGVRDVPIFMLTLTRAGVAEVSRHFDDDKQLYAYSNRVNYNQMRHDHLAQKMTLQAMREGQADRHTPERILRVDAMRKLARETKEEREAREARGILVPKISDVVWTTRTGLTTFAEIELSGKFKRDLDEFVHKCIEALHTTPNSTVLIISDSGGTLVRYRKAFEPSAPVGKWKKVDGRWVQIKTWSVPDWVAARIQYRKLEK